MRVTSFSNIDAGDVSPTAVQWRARLMWVLGTVARVRGALLRAVNQLRSPEWEVEELETQCVCAAAAGK